MAYLSEMTLKAVMDREKFSNIEEVQSYFCQKYPGLLIDEKLLESYFPSREKTMDDVSSLTLLDEKENEVVEKTNTDIQMINISKKKRNMIILSEYLKHNFTYSELFYYLEKKYPNIYFPYHSIKTTLNPVGYSDGIVRLLTEKQLEIKKQIDVRRTPRFLVTNDFPYRYLLNDNVSKLTFYELKYIIAIHFYLSGFSLSFIARKIKVYINELPRYFESPAFLSICKPEYVSQIHNLLQNTVNDVSKKR